MQADSKWKLRINKLGQERGVFDRSHAVHDPLRAERLDSSADGVRAGFLTGVGDGMEAASASLGEEVGEQLRRKRRLFPTEADADDRCRSWRDTRAAKERFGP